MLLLAALALAAPPPSHAFPQRMAERWKSGTAGLPPGAVKAVGTPGGHVVIEMAGGAQYVLGDGGQWKAASTHAPLGGPVVDAARLPAGVAIWNTYGDARGRTWAVTDRGAYLSNAGGAFQPVSKPKQYLTRQDPVDIDALFTCVAEDATGAVWYGTSAGMYATMGDYWVPYDHRNGMPSEVVTCIAFGATGDVWAGTKDGVARYTGNGQWQYYKGPRWLPDDTVNGIACDPAGGAWVATEGGVAHLHDVGMTLGAKAAHYEQITEARHDRYGYVTGGSLKTPGDPSGGPIYEASDNDGLWTAVYVGAESFRYAATHDPAALATARKSMHAMLDLVKYTGIPGFPARAVVRKDEKDVSGYDPVETVRIPGETQKIWFQSPVDPNVLCKGDTSSDELDGHYFAWYTYYQFAADAAEKKRVAETVAAVTDNILNHGLYLVGHTGGRTLWGVWNPSFLNDNPTWWEERGINSLEILSYLKLAHYVTGDAKYERKYQELIRDHHYLLNLVNQKVDWAWYGENHSDDQMSWMMYYVLLSLEHDPDIHRMLARSADRSFRDARPEHSPFFDFVYGSATGLDCDAGGAQAELESWPWELIDWRCDNSHRADVALRRFSGGGQEKVETERALPAAERQLMRWNGNPYDVSGGTADGRDEEDGSAWLLPYWMGVYHHLLPNP